MIVIGIVYRYSQRYGGVTGALVGLSQATIYRFLATDDFD